jgi:hypothetical protein
MTLLGIIIIVVGFVALLTSRRWLYGLFLFSIPFSGTAVFNTGSGNNASGVQAWMYFGVLLLLRDLCGWLLNPNANLALPIIKRGMFLMIFILVLTVSLLMPVYINGRLQIVSYVLTDYSSTPLYFSTKNITALLYIVFGSLLAISIARRNVEADEARFTERTYLAAGMLTCVLGLSEFFAHMFNCPSPTVLFRNSASPGAGNYLGLLEGGMGRISSVAVEPSILAQYLCTVFPLTMPALLGRGFIYSIRVDRFAFYLLLVVFLLSTSSTAYLMLIAAPVLCMPVILKLGIKATRAVMHSILAFTIFACGAGAMYMFSSTFQQILNTALFTKGESYSALERFKTVGLAWEYFKAYPALGVGWGSVTSHDLLFMILANSGLLGLSAFILLLYGIARPILRLMKRSQDSVTLSRSIWLISGILLIASSIVTGAPFVYGFFWIVLAMCIAAGGSDYRAPVNASISNQIPTHVVPR